MEKINKNKIPTYVKIIILSAIALIFVAKIDLVGIGIKKFFNAISSLLVGAVIAFMLNIPTNFFERLFFQKSKNKLILKSKRFISFILSLILVVLVLAVILKMVVPQAIESIKIFANAFPDAYLKAYNFIEKLTINYPDLQNELYKMIPDSKEIVKTLYNTFLFWASGAVNVIGSLFGKIMNLIFSLIFAVYIVLGKDRLKSQFDRMLNWMIGLEKKEKLYYVLNVANISFRNFVTGQTIEAFVLGGLCTVGMMILKLPYATMLGSLVGLTAIIPVIGAYIGAIFGFFIILSTNLTQAIVFVVFLTILQQFEGNLIYPKVVGDKIGLPGLWVLAAVLVGSSLFGVAGTFLGVPVTATIYKLLANKTVEFESVQTSK